MREKLINMTTYEKLLIYLKNINSVYYKINYYFFNIIIIKNTK